MKKLIYIAVSGLLIGTIFALIMFKSIKRDVESVIKETKTATIFQTGVFSIYDNALKEKEKYNNAYVYKDDEVYRVILGVYANNEIIVSLKKYYEKKDVEIYLKEIIVSDKFYEELKKYETLLNETNNIDNYIIANKNILEKFGELNVASN